MSGERSLARRDGSWSSRPTSARRRGDACTCFGTRGHRVRIVAPTFGDRWPSSSKRGRRAGAHRGGAGRRAGTGACFVALAAAAAVVRPAGPRADAGTPTPRHRGRRALERLSNVTLLERPRPRALVSAVQAALRARRRQYQIRDQLEELIAPSRRCATPIGARTNSSPRSRTSCAIRWRRSAPALAAARPASTATTRAVAASARR